MSDQAICTKCGYVMVFQCRFEDLVAAQAAENATLRAVAKAAQDFQDKLSALQPAIDGAFAFQQLHGFPYQGDTYAAELIALRDALAEIRRFDGVRSADARPLSR